MRKPAATNRQADSRRIRRVIEKLSGLHPIQAKLIQMRWSESLTLDEAARTLGIPVRLAERHLRVAKAYMLAELVGHVST